jgi:nitrate/nitrite-specific signal transduction histidine kinase
MTKISLKVAYPIIITGLFIIVIFVALNYENLSPDFYMVLIPLTAFLFLFGFASGQKFALPVKKLLKGADYISKGNFKSRFLLEEKDELGQLSKVFNNIAEEFENHELKITTLDNKVKLRTKALEEIILVLEQKIKNRTLELQNALEDLEKTQIQTNIKGSEIMDLKNQIVSLTKKKRAKKVKL